MAVPFVDLKRGTAARDAAVEEAVLRVLQHKKFILGPEVEAFEETMSGALDGVHAIGVSSGTDALLLALTALEVGPGDAVLTTPFSFFATAGVIARLGARPVFTDIDPEHYGPDLEALRAHDPEDYRAVVPVHLFGHTLDLDPLREWAGARTPILEDAAQAVLGRDPAGRPAGTVGDFGAFSFFPTKNLGAPGDAGLLVTPDAERAARARMLRVHGQSGTYVHERVGGNFRLDAIHAAALDATWPFLEADTAARRANAARYRALFADRGIDAEAVSLPLDSPHHTYHQFVVRVRHGRRDAVREGLAARGIGAGVYYPLPFHLQPCFRSLGHEEGAFPAAEAAAAEVLALPIFPGLTAAEQEEVVDGLVAALAAD